MGQIRLTGLVINAVVQKRSDKYRECYFDRFEEKNEQKSILLCTRN